VVRNLPEVKPETSLLGVSDTAIPLQAASTSGLPATGGQLGHLVPGVGGFLVANKALSECVRQKLKKAKARASKAETGGIHQPGNASVLEQGETSTETCKRLRSEDSTPTKRAIPSKRPGGSSEPGNYKEVLTNTDSYLQGDILKLTEHNQESILKKLGRVLRGTPIELPHLKSYRLEGGALIVYKCESTSSLVNGSSEL
jgi:hypothetical protein